MIKATIHTEWKDLYRGNDDGVRREKIHAYVLDRLVTGRDEDIEVTIDKLLVNPPDIIKNRRERVQYAIEVDRWIAMDKRFRLHKVQASRIKRKESKDES